MMTDLTRPAHWCKSTTNIMGVSNHFLTVSKSLSTGSNTYLAPLADLELKDWQVIGFREECITIMLLSGHTINLT